MKKIAIVVMLVMITSAAFAEVTVGGNIQSGWTFLEGRPEGSGRTDNQGNNDNLGTVLNWYDGGDFEWRNQPVRARINVTAVNADKTMGAWAQLRPFGGIDDGLLANVWWQPSPKFKATLGYIWGGGNMTAGVTTANDEMLPIQLYGRSHGWVDYRVFHPWGWEPDYAASVEFFPSANLYAIISVPFHMNIFGYNAYDKHTDAATIFANTAARVAYTVPKLAQFVLTYDGGTGKINGDALDDRTEGTGKVGYVLKAGKDGFVDGTEDTTKIIDVTEYELGEIKETVKGAINDDPIYIGFHVNLLAVENLDLSFCFMMPFAEKTFKTWTDKGFGSDFTYQRPAEMDLRAGYTAGDFNITGSLAMTFAGYQEISGNKTDTPLVFGVTLNPSYNLGIVKAGLVGEMRITAEEEDALGKTVHDAKTELNFIPYVSKDLAGGSVWAGFQLKVVPQAEAGGTGWENKVQWGIPVGFTYSF